MKSNQIEQRVREVLEKLEMGKMENFDEAIKEVLNQDKLVEYKNSKIATLNEELDNLRRENKQKEREIKRLKGISKLENLTAVEDKDLDTLDLATLKEREKLASKFEHFIELLKDNRYLAKTTLETFDFYRERFVDRCIKEKDLGDQIDNLTS